MQKIETFFRYEFKYFMSDKLSNAILKDSLDFMKIDQFAEKNIDEGYFVRSLYFDNQDYDNFFEKVDGVKIRKKFRLRTYSKKFDDKTLIFLEMKGRKKDRIFKERIKIENKDLEYFYSLKNLEKLNQKYKNNNLINDFVYNVFRKRIKPKILIDYNRKPLINKNGLYFRLTFDNNLVSSKSTDLFNEMGFNFPVKYKPGNSILEVKFERSMPAWFHRIIQSYDLRRESISKFVLGVCNCKIREETSD